MLYKTNTPCGLKAGSMIPLSIATYATKIFLREYNVNRIFLSNIGLWPFQNRLTRNLLWTFCFLLEISYCPFEILLLYDHWDNTQTIFEGLYQIVLSASFLVRIMNEFWNRDKIRRLYQTIDEHWNMFTNDVEVRILKDYSTLSRKFTKYYAMLMYVMMSGFIVIPLTPAFLDVIMPVNESRPRFLAIEVEFRVNKDEYFLLIFCYTTAICVVGISIMVSVDAMHITCTAHACSLFAVVSKQVENIISKIDNNNENEYRYLTTELNLSSEEMIYREYITCLKKHQLAIEFVNILESSYQELSLVLLILVIATLSLIGIRIVYVLNQLEETTRFMFIIMGALMTLMIVCYSGQRLMDESQNVFYRAYAAKWYNFSPRLKSLLLITLYRSNIPCGLKAGNIVPLSIATYATVVRMGMSYFTAFLSLKDK
ncbi:odorant receptor 9a-like [Pogonomyrmex barbatus]|uniref:Odorant receptor n=1 Tax=Pogonomyrmex barbatus TaxID=144034 RepID=A0A8N1SBP1_9HYME|nr:odorant receptor 9a-like [Pogonomyrmex barbatus]